MATTYSEIPLLTPQKLQDWSEMPIQGFTDQYLENQLLRVRDRIHSLYGAKVLQRLNRGLLTEATLFGVMADAVLRILRNPDGFTREMEGDYQYEKRSVVAAGYLYFTEDNLLDLLGAGGTTLPGTISVGVHGWAGGTL